MTQKNCLHSKMSMINPSQSHLTAKQLRIFHFWAKTASIKTSLGEKTLLKTKTDFNFMFADIAPLHPMSRVAVKQAQELYCKLLRDTIENDGNTWKVDQYLKSLCE